MSTGSENNTSSKDDTTSRLYCDGVPFEDPVDEDGAGDTDANTLFKPNVVVYGDTTDGEANMRNTINLILSPWTTDFSIEAWICRNYPDSITNWGSAAASAQGYGLTGLRSENVSPAVNAGFWFRGANFEACFSEYDWSNQVQITGVLPFGWCHVAATYDRDGNMTLYVNGTSQGTADISTSSGHNSRWNNFSVLQTILSDATSNSMKEQPPFRVAGIALHTALLTAAQVQDSVDNITLQDLSSTIDRFFFSDTVLLPNVSTHSTVGTFYWTDPYDAPTLVNTAGSSGGTAATTTDIADALTELPADIELEQLQETLYLTTLGSGSIKDFGARTFMRSANSSVGALHCDWYSSIFAASTALFEAQVVFGDDPSWPPSRGIDEKGYA